MSEAALRDYLKNIEKAYQKGNATEHTYRSDLEQLLESILPNITATNEPKRVKCGAPDYMVERNTTGTTLTIGYVEAKDIEVDLDAIERDSRLSEPKTREGNQLKRYLRSLDNLIFTNYVDFRWYVLGEKRMTARLSIPRPDRHLPLDKDGMKNVADLLHNFLDHSVEQIRKPQELAQRMARLTHIIRDIIIEAFEQKQVSDTILDLYTSFKETLLPQLTAPEFADMFAQTLAYGLFAARYNHKSKKPFRREDAAKEIPRTNPFLRKLFSTIAGPDLDDEPYAGFVDELAQTLAVTDMDAVLANFGKLTRQEDPIVHFYETFLAQYDPKLRELRGVYYTPQPVVSYIVRSVDHLLRTHFDCPDGLADTSLVSYKSTDENGESSTVISPRALLLDPACGTGTFLYNVIEHIRDTYRQTGNAGMWSGYVRQHLLPRLFGFELLMAPYAMAHLKLGMQLAAADLPEAERATWAYDFQTDERLGLYLTNTLEEAVKRSEVMFGRYISEEANEAAKVKQGYPVMVVLGNPPYSGHSANKGPWITKLIETYKEGCSELKKPAQAKWLSDDYVKFIRFAQWRIERTGYGILAFITNHSYLDNPTFRCMRQSLMQSFDDIYILDLHGNSKKKEEAINGRKDENVFDIQQGVAIGLFVKLRKASHTPHSNVHHASLWGPREVYEPNEQGQATLTGGKYHWLASHSIANTPWEILTPEAPFYLFTPQDRQNLAEYETGWKVPDIFRPNGDPAPGIVTTQDEFAISWTKAEAIKKVEQLLATDTEAEARQLFRLCAQDQWQYAWAKKELMNGQWRQELVEILYRPFDLRWTVFNRYVAVHRRERVMRHMLAGQNVGITIGRAGQVIDQGEWDIVFCSRYVTEYNLYRRGGNNLFPIYLYPDSSKTTLFDAELQTDAPGGRRPNLASTFTADFSQRLRLDFISDGKETCTRPSVPRIYFITCMPSFIHHTIEVVMPRSSKSTSHASHSPQMPNFFENYAS